MNLINKHIYFLLLGVIFIAAFFRTHQLAIVPPSASLDEATTGYNAYSILQTGKDEYGTSFPIILRAYDDYRPALYTYLTIPFIKLFGLTTEAVRLPSALLSIASVLNVYFLVEGLFSTLKNKKILGLLVSFLLAISPWSIYVSRLGHEANAGFAFFIFFLTLFVRKKYISSFFFFALSFASYQSEKVFLPLVFVSLVIIYKDDLLRARKKVFLGFIIMLIILIPFIKISLSPQALIRFKATSAFQDTSLYQQSANQLLIDKMQHNYISLFMDNRRLIPVKIFLDNYISHFNPQWLFSSVGREDFKVPYVGLLYLWEFPCILIGMVYAIRAKFPKSTKLTILTWTIASFVPGALTTGASHALRSYTLLPVPQILTALGLIAGFVFLQKFLKQKSIFIALLLVVVVAMSIKNFYFSYFYLFPKQLSEPYQYALSQAIKYVQIHKNEYHQIIISNQDNLYQSYMFYLFFTRYNPVTYQKMGGTKSGGFAVTHAYDTVVFRPLVWPDEKKDSSILYVGNPSDFLPNASILFKGSYLDQKVGVLVVKG